MRKIIHIELKKEHSHHYFGSVPAVFEDPDLPYLGVSKSRIEKHDKSKPYENKICIIRFGRLLTSTEVRKNKPRTK